MPGPLVVGAEGVILIPDDDAYASSRPIMEGIELVMQLRHFPTSRCVVLVGTEDITAATYFMKLNGLPDVAVVPVAGEDRHIEGSEAQWFNVKRQRAAGPVNMVLTAYNRVFDMCKGSHQPALLFGRRGALGANEPMATWGQLQERVTNERNARAEVSG